MNSRLMVRMTAPIVASSFLLLAVGLGTAWYVERWQSRVSEGLLTDVSGIRAAEELEILIRETRTRLDHFLITGDRRCLTRVPELRTSIEIWLAEAERWGVTPDEKLLTDRVRQGNQQFWNQWEQISTQSADAPLPGLIRNLIDGILVQEMLEPAHEYLDLNEEEVKEAIEKNQVFADRLVYSLLLLGTCGSAAGLLAGFGFARALRRSLLQLSVLVQDTAGRLHVRVEPVAVLGTNLAELESVLRLIDGRVRNMVETLQQREREALVSEQLATLGQMAAGLAHELRNPLTSMKILVQGALASFASAEFERDGSDSQRLSSRDLAVLEEEILRLERLLQSFLDLARPPKPYKHVSDLRPLVIQSIAFLENQAAGRSITIDSDVGAAPLYADVDVGQFRQLIFNLVLNALEAMPAGGNICVALKTEGGGWLALEVADRGVGLPPSLGEKIFDPFTTTKDTGLGLGLSVCKRIAAAHAGTLTCADRVGGGVVFTFRLPTASASLPAA